MQEYIKELENKYKKFILKKYLTIVFFLILFVLFLVGIYFIVDDYEHKKQILTKAKKEQKILNEKLKMAQIQNEKNKILKNKDLKKQNVIISSKIINLKDLKQDFYTNPHYDKALYLAQFYFNNKEYKKSIFWSLKANEIDSAKMQAWIIFIKANQKLGYKDKASQAIQTYIDIYGVFDE